MVEVFVFMWYPDAFLGNRITVVDSEKLKPGLDIFKVSIVTIMVRDVCWGICCPRLELWSDIYNKFRG